MTGYPDGAAVVAIVGEAWFEAVPRGAVVEVGVLPDGE
jgi:hypothetical protein